MFFTEFRWYLNMKSFKFCPRSYLSLGSCLCKYYVGMRSQMKDVAYCSHMIGKECWSGMVMWKYSKDGWWREYNYVDDVAGDSRCIRPRVEMARYEGVEREIPRTWMCLNSTYGSCHLSPHTWGFQFLWSAAPPPAPLYGKWSGGDDLSLHVCWRKNLPWSKVSLTNLWGRKDVMWCPMGLQVYEAQLWT